jgi:hypothetical protein
MTKMKTMLLVWISIAALLAAAPIGKARAEDLPAFAECKGKAIDLYTSKSIGVLEFADTLKACQVLASIPDAAPQPAAQQPAAQSTQPPVNVTVTQVQAPPQSAPQPVVVQPVVVQPQPVPQPPRYAKAVCTIAGTRLNYYITVDVRSKDAYVGGRPAQYTYLPRKGTYVGIDDLTIFVADRESGLSSSTTKNGGGIGIQALDCSSFV